MVSIIEVLEIIGGFIGIFAIIIVIWDHFKDDRRLTKEVQEYYEHIENFLATYIKIRQHQGNHDEASIYIAEFEYFRSIVKQRLPDFSKYLGLILGKSRDRRYQDEDAYLTKIGHVLVENGNLLFRDPTILGSYEKHAIGNSQNLRRSEIPNIDNFFSDLRGHWQKFYHKTIFRPKLKKRINFHDFIVVDE